MKIDRRLITTAAGLIALTALIALFEVNSRRSPSTPKSQATALAKSADGVQIALAAPSSETPARSVPPASTGMSLRPVSMINGQSVAYAGAFAKASIKVGGKDYELTPNQMGYFGRIDVGPKAVSQISVAFPQGQKGDAVAVVVEDGGHLNVSQMSEVATLDDQKAIAFNFTTTEQAGIYRIALHSGADVKVLNFWVGQEQPLRE